jgi:type II secretory pathway pseudopilin PulG
VFKAHKSGGFTLIELMLVAAMMGAIGLTIVATFAGGLKIFNRMENYTATRAEVLLAAEKMERDLRNTFPLKGIDFIGDAEKMTFPAILKTALSEEQIKESPGSVSYYRGGQEDGSALFREEKTYTQALKREGSARGSIMDLVPVEDVNFQYFSYDPDAKAYSWVDAWDKSESEEDEDEVVKATKNTDTLEERPENLPLGVKLKMSYRDGGKTLTLERTVFIKTAVSLNRAKKKALLGKQSSQGVSNE